MCTVSCICNGDATVNTIEIGSGDYEKVDFRVAVLNWTRCVNKDLGNVCRRLCLLHLRVQKRLL